MPAPHVQLGGLLGQALDASRRGRLFHFIEGPGSDAIRLFDIDVAATNTAGDWYGEHAGKWLWAASRAASQAASRSGDEALVQRVHAVADHLCAQQRPDGYLGTYAESHRFMVKQPPKAHTWDGAPSVRTWDIWVHSYLVLGLLEAHRHFAQPRWLDAARRIGELCLHTLRQGDITITELGNHHGLSATVLLDPAMELHAATGEQRWLDLALLIVDQADREPALGLLTQVCGTADASEIATGKAYQLAWMLVGLAKLQRATQRADLLQGLQRLWTNIRDHHLSLGGGPYGGIASRSRETFNPAGVFNPGAYVETCSTLAWMQLNRELLAITGEARFAEEIERSAYNDLLAAAAPDGHDWCYYTYANGRRVHTTTWRCCKSSGAMALQLLPELACRASGLREVTVDLHGPFSADVQLDGAAPLRVQQHGAYPFDGQLVIELTPPQPLHFTLRLRVPSWATGATLLTPDGAPTPVTPGRHAVVDRLWAAGDRVELHLPMPVLAHRRANANVQVSIAPEGGEVRQTVLHDEYVAVTRGPLVYAAGLIDGFKPNECVHLPALDVEDTAAWTQVIEGDSEGPTLRLSFPGRPPIDMVPAYRAGGREHGAWRVTWLQRAPSSHTADTADKFP